MLRIHVAIATTGRPGVVAETVNRLLCQTPLPERILVVGASESDVESLRGAASPIVEITLSERGLCRQRNAALDILEQTSDVIAFLDDDYVPVAGVFGALTRFFASHHEVVVATGKLLADGIMSPGLSFAEADTLVRAYSGPPAEPTISDTAGAYGCNMIIRSRVAVGMRFDERLVLYGWQEDIDYSSRLRAFGRVVRTDAFAGVHLGVKIGRTSGKRLGYSQIANPLYLWRKGTMTTSHAMRLIIKNFLKNLVRSFYTESYIDRLGRLKGNIHAIIDIFRGRCYPERILD